MYNRSKLHHLLQLHFSSRNLLYWSPSTNAVFLSIVEELYKLIFYSISMSISTILVEEIYGDTIVIPKSGC